MTGPAAPRDGRYPRPRAALRLSAGAVAMACALAAATISVLPLFGMLSAKQYADVEIRTAPDVVYVPPPVEQTALVPEPEEEEEKPRPAILRSARPAPSVPKAEAPMILTTLPGADLEVEVGDADLGLWFDVRRPAPPPASAARPEPPPPPPEPEQVIPDTEPVPLLRPEPRYPAIARRRGIEGYVELLLLVSEEGRVTDVEVKDSAPGDTFVDTSVRTVRRWRFRPATRNGRPLAAWIEQRIRFETEKGR